MKSKISCICPTRGRFETLRESISFFLLQDYPNKELIIFNNHPQSIIPHPKLIKHNIKVINAGDYSGMSMQKVYADCLKHISDDSEYISIWDDDDFYFPFHLSSGMEIIKKENTFAVRSYGGYWQDNLNPMGDDYIIVKNTLEASMIVKRDKIFFDENITDTKAPEFTHPHSPWIKKYELLDKNKFSYNHNITAVFRWHYSRNYNHLQSSGPHNNHEDTGKGEFLRPKPVKHLFYDVLEKIYLNIKELGKVKKISKEEKSELYRRIINHDIDQFDHIDKFNVWLYWNDKNKIPTFINECLKSISENTFAKAVVLDDESLKDYNLPDYFWNLTSVEKADFIRIYFLNKFGGWWFDADTFVVGDLDYHYFRHLINNETYFPSEYNTEGLITTPLLCSKPNGLIIRTALKNIHNFLINKIPPYNLGWAKLGFVGILDSVNQYRYTLGWHFVTVNDIVKWGYNNHKIKEWDFSDINKSKLQIYVLHWSQIGAELSWKIGNEITIEDIIREYPNLRNLLVSYKEMYT